MKTKTALALLCGLLSMQHASAESTDDWIGIASTSYAEWSGQKGSGHMVSIDGKKNAGYGYIVQKKDIKKNSFEYYKAFVHTSTCAKGYGYVIYNDLDANFTGQDQFVRFGTTVSDQLGTMACRSWDEGTGKVSMQDNQQLWEFIGEATNSQIKYYATTNPVRKIAYKSKPSAALLYREYNPKADTSEYYELIVRIADCKSGYGKSYRQDFSGKEISTFDYAIGGKSVGAIQAQSVCEKI